VIRGNRIGTNAAGTAAIPNADRGVNLNNSADNVVGGTAPGARNIISGNGNFGKFADGIGIFNAGSTGNQVLGNYIGVDVAGQIAIPNTAHGINSTGVGSVIGGEAPGAGNVISGNGSAAVFSVGVGIFGGSGNVIRGNRIGTNALGTAAIPNADRGVEIVNSSDNVVGGTTPGARNIISGNGNFGKPADGLAIFSAANQVLGNYIGIDASGDVALGNARNGIYITGSSNVIGGEVAGAGNVISGNGDPALPFFGGGIQIWGADNVVQGNRIGTNAAGTAAVPNKSRGVDINSSNNVIGGLTDGARNVISGNGFSPGAAYGVGVFSPGMNNQILGNYVGTDATGAIAIANTAGGVLIRASNTTVGGTVGGAGNVVAFNQGAGVAVLNDGISSPIRGNSIFSNTGLGIDLAVGFAPNGVTLNDAGDGDAGPNDLQNFPVLNQVTSGNTNVRGALNSTANSVFTLDFYASPACDPSGSGEGQRHLGSTVVATDAAGDAGFSLALPGVSAVGEFVTATATSGNGNTSEFSACATVQAPASALSIPAPLTPAAAAVIVQNNPDIGCTADPTRGYGFQIVFDWTDSAPAGDVASYEVVARHTTSPNPLFSEVVAGSTFTYTSCNGFVVDSNLSNWEWRVRAKDTGGQVTNWSPTTAFEFAACRLEDMTACRAP
jgi:hypothetical protein